MTTPDADGIYDLTRDFYYTRSDEKGVPCQAPCFDKMREHFLTPKAVRWAGAIPYIRKKVVDVACGGFHILVAASDSSSPALYTSGLNQYGQLGHGDLVDRHELTRVTSIDNMALFAGLLVRRS
jgi:alpha-tubulin suppressor-like RCC1 family protein